MLSPAALVYSFVLVVNASKEGHATHFNILCACVCVMGIWWAFRLHSTASIQGLVCLFLSSLAKAPTFWEVMVSQRDSFNRSALGPPFGKKMAIWNLEHEGSYYG